PASAAAKQSQGGSADGAPKSAAKAVEGLEELWDASQYEDEYNLDQFIQSLDP
ncbi:hypothetical protein IWW50_002740, partial [Coemansia erecta]